MYTNFQEEEGIKLACDAILAGVFNDLGSGSNVDICIIKKDGTRMLRNYLTPNKKPATYVLHFFLFLFMKCCITINN